MIYFIRDTQSGLIKIGFSNNVPLRLKTLQTGHPYVLELIGTLDATERDERLLHKSLSAYRVRGEWFYPTGPLADISKSLPPIPPGIPRKPEKLQPILEEFSQRPPSAHEWRRRRRKEIEDNPSTSPFRREMLKFEERLSAARLTFRALSRETNIQPANLSRYLNGRSEPSMTNWIKMNNALNKLIAERAEELRSLA